MWLVMAAAPAFADCAALDESLVTLRELRQDRREAFLAVNGADWKTRLALAEDRDAVLAEQAAATQALEDARSAVKGAKDDKKQAIASCRAPERHAAG